MTFRVIIDGNMFRENLHNRELAVSEAQGLVSGWRGRNIMRIPVVSVVDGSGNEVWTSKEDQS
jgi:hypothetical protein